MKPPRVFLARVLTAAALGASIQGCSSTAPAPTLSVVNPQVGSTITSGQFSFTATAKGSEPNIVVIELVVKNVSTSGATLTTTGCDVDMRLYASSGTRSFSLRDESLPCTPGIIRYGIDPGFSATLTYYLPAQLARSRLEPGTYTVKVTVPSVVPELEVSAGTVIAQ